MTTKKHKVSAYLTDDEFEVLKGLATQYQVSQSQIVILAIRELAKLGQVELMELPVGYLPNAISGVTKEDMELLVKNEVKTAIAELQTNFENQLGEFKSLVADTAITDGTMKAAITPLNLQIKRLKGLIFNAPIDLEKENERPFFTLDERVKYLEIELGELKKGQRDRVTAIPEKHTPDDALPSLETDNQDKTPISLIKEPEIVVNPLIAGLDVDQATECPFIVGRSYTQQELKTLFNTKHGSDIINWIEEKKGSKNPIAQKYSRCFTAKGVGKDKIYVFNGE
jgi:hypothetical protein